MLLKIEVTYFKTDGLKNFINKWKCITNDDWILEALSGYKIEFYQNPIRTVVPHNLNFNEQNCALIDDEVVER